MAIAFDAISGPFAATATSLTYAHICTGADRFLRVNYHGDTASDVITGATYAAAAMTKVGASVQCPADRFIGSYILPNPASGSNNVVITGSSSKGIRSYAVSYTGAKQTGQPDANSSGTGSAVSSITGTVTTIADNSWVSMFSKDNDGTGSYTAGAGTTLRNSSDAGGHINSDSNAAKTPAGSASLIHNFGGSRNVAQIIISIAPSVAASTRLLSLTGVGK